MLVAYTITAIERDVSSTEATGKQIIVGASCSMYSQPGDTVVQMYDDSSYTNGSTAKTTGANGQVVVWVEQGRYRLSVNGVSSYVSVGSDVPIDAETFAELEASSPVQTGQRFICREFGNAEFILDVSGATFEKGDIVFANGRLGKLQLDTYANIEHFGAKRGYSVDSYQAITDADERAAANDLILTGAGDYYISQGLTFTARTIRLNVSIQKALTDEPGIAFDQTVKSVSGFIKVFHPTRPTTETLACGFFFTQVLHASFDCTLQCEKVYSGFKNDTTADYDSWGNYFSSWKVRDFVTKAVDWGQTSAGASTGNFIGFLHINGKEFDSNDRVPVTPPIMHISNHEGLTIGCLNLEAINFASAGAYIDCINNSTLSIGSVHLEFGLFENAGFTSVFKVSTTDLTSNINVDNLWISNCVQTDGTIFLVQPSVSPKGVVNIGTLAGQAFTNTFTDFRMILGQSTSELSLRLIEPKNWDDYFTNMVGGSARTDFAPALWLGNNPVSIAPVDSDGSSTVNVGMSNTMTLTGTAPTDIDTITATQLPGEVSRIINVINNTDGSTDIVAGGNIDLTGRGTTAFANAGKVVQFVYDFNTNTSALLKA